MSVVSQSLRLCLQSLCLIKKTLIRELKNNGSESKKAYNIVVNQLRDAFKKTCCHPA